MAKLSHSNEQPTCASLPLALLCVVFYFVIVTFRYSVLGQVWYLNGSILDLCLLLFTLQ